MNLQETLRELKSYGTAQNRKVYKRHGAGDNLYGVSFANLNKLRKKINTDHKLAQKLWATGNADARSLATMIADPVLMTEKEAQQWLQDLDYYLLVDLLTGVVSKTTFSKKKMEQWIRSRDEYVGQAGWGLLARYAMSGPAPDTYFVKYLEIIQKRIHSSKNRIRHAMNNALIAIGIRNAALEKKAVAAAKAIGKVVVDHGETNCKTPDAISYIRKARKRKKSA